MVRIRRMAAFAASAGLLGFAVFAQDTFTNLYNQRPTWLADAHRRLADAAPQQRAGWIARQMRLPCGVVVNRVGIGDDRVQAFCRENAVPVLAELINCSVNCIEPRHAFSASFKTR